MTHHPIIKPCCPQLKHERDNILDAQQLVFSDGRMLMSFLDLNSPDKRAQYNADNPESLPALFRQSSFDSNDGQMFRKSK